MSIILDSSALLARLLREPGEDAVNAGIAADAGMSSLKLAEVMARLVRAGVPRTTAERALAALPVAIHCLDEVMALQAGAMIAVTRKIGLSLGDRACLVLARRENLPVLTGDSAWIEAGPLTGVRVRLIR